MNDLKPASEDYVEYDCGSAVKTVWARCADNTDRPIVLRRGTEVVGVIHRLRDLVETHSFPGSPFPIGQLLRNAVLAAQLVRDTVPAPGRWWPLHTYDGHLIAVLAPAEAPVLPDATQPALAA